MTEKIVNGDYIMMNDSDNIQSVEYIDEVIQTIKMLLVTQRGKFYPNKDFGSLLKQSLPQPSEEYALAYARQALEGLDGVFVNTVRVDNGTIYLNVSINSEEKQVIQQIENYI